MRLIRTLFTFALLGALVYVAYAVPLGTKTLLEHLHAIAQTSESKQLVEEVKQKADEVIHRDSASSAAKPAARGDELTAQERRLLRRLIKDKLEQAELEQAERPAEAETAPPPR